MTVTAGTTATTKRVTSRTAAFVWMTAAQLLFSLMALGARFVGRDLPWQEVAAARMVVALVLTYGIARARGASLRIHDQKHAWLRTIFGTLAAAGSFYVYARPMLSLGDAVTLINTSPIFVALLSWPLLGERVPWRVALVIAVSFVGILGVAQPSFQASVTVVMIGVGSALCTAFAMVSLRKMGTGESSEAIVFHFMCFGTLALAVACVPVWKTPDLHAIGFLFLTGLAGGLAQLTMTRAYQLDAAAEVSAIGYSGVVFTRVIALLAFAELPGLLQIAGSVLVVASGVFLALRATPRAPSTAN